jgi:hypothetical protein
MLSRRIFVTTALGAGAVLATQDHKAAAQADRRMIVDAQIHLWKAESEDWRWVPGLQPQLPEPFTIERAISMMDEAGVDRAVIVPPSWPGDRNDYALEGNRSHEFVRQGELPPAHQPLYGRVELLQRERQGLGDGPRDRAAPEVDLIGFVEAVCTLSIVVACPARKCEDRSEDDSNSFAASQPLAPSKSPLPSSRGILASW